MYNYYLSRYGKQVADKFAWGGEFETSAGSGQADYMHVGFQGRGRHKRADWAYEDPEILKRYAGPDAARNAQQQQQAAAAGGKPTVDNSVKTTVIQGVTDAEGVRRQLYNKDTGSSMHHHRTMVS